MFFIRYPVNTKHLYIISTMLDQRRRRWADFVQMLYKCSVFTWYIMLGVYTFLVQEVQFLSTADHIHFHSTSTIFAFTIRQITIRL